MINEYAPKKVDALIPTLSFYPKKKRRLTDDYTDEQKAAYEKFHQDVIDPFFASMITDFQSRFPHSKVVVIPDGHHYCFIAQEDLVYEEMSKFLNDVST